MNLSQEYQTLEWYVEDSLAADMFKYIEMFVRVISVLIHFVYFMILFLISKFHTKPYLYLHHMNFIGFIYCLHFCFYFYYSHPQLSNPGLENLLCTLSEFLWGLLKYLRAYSLLMLAFYRHVSIFNYELYQKLNKSNFSIVTPIILLWIISLVLFLFTKFAFKITYGYYNCYDGFSTSYDSSLNYYIVSSILGNIVPLILVFIIILKISFKLKPDLVKIIPEKLFKKTQENLNDPKNVAQNIANEELSSQRRFLKKLITFYVFFLAMLFTSLFLNLRDIITNYYFYIVISRILNIFFQALVPITSLYYYRELIFQKFSANRQN